MYLQKHRYLDRVASISNDRCTPRHGERLGRSTCRGATYFPAREIGCRNDPGHVGASRARSSTIEPSLRQRARSCPRAVMSANLLRPNI